MISHLAKCEECEGPEFESFCERMGMDPNDKARKLWEYFVIANAIEKHLPAGGNGLGFGVGRERLVSLFAADGFDVLATDQALSESVDAAWAKTGQHSSQLSDLFYPEIIAEPEFNKRVRFEACDMNAIPERYIGKYDFTYSACSMDHLGSIPKSLAFFVNACRCLKPGGIAVHTTEYNIIAVNPAFRGRTTVAGSTVFWRPEDIEHLIKAVRNAGFTMDGPDYSRGTHYRNYDIDWEPHEHPHFTLQVCTGPENGGGWIITSIVLIATRPR